MYFISTIKGLGLEIAKKNNQVNIISICGYFIYQLMLTFTLFLQTMNLTVQSALFYVKFKAIAPKLKELVSEIEKRCPVHREYVIISYTFYCYYYKMYYLYMK